VNVVTVDLDCHCLCCKSCYTLDDLKQQSHSTIATPALALKSINKRVSRFSKPTTALVHDKLQHHMNRVAYEQHSTDRRVPCPSSDTCEGSVSSMWHDPTQHATQALLHQHNQINASLAAITPGLMKKVVSGDYTSSTKRNSACACKCSGCKCSTKGASRVKH
jgi:hypothetical protein